MATACCMRTIWPQASLARSSKTPCRIAWSGWNIYKPWSKNETVGKTCTGPAMRCCRGYKGRENHDSAYLWGTAPRPRLRPRSARRVGGVTAGYRAGRGSAGCAWRAATAAERCDEAAGCAADLRARAATPRRLFPLHPFFAGVAGAALRLPQADSRALHGPAADHPACQGTRATNAA